MKSLFGRQFSLYAIVIIFGFALLGSTFMYQVNVFSEKEKQTQLDKVVTRAAQQTQDYLIYTKMWNSIEYNLAYMRNMQQLAQDLDGIIFVADRDGNLMFVAREDGCFQQTGGVMPKEATDILLDTGSYYVQMSKFYDWLSTACHIQGVTVKNAVSNGVDGMVFAAAPPNNVLYFNLSRTFLLIIMIVLLLTLIV